MRLSLAPFAKLLPAAVKVQGRDGLLFQRLFGGALAGCLITLLLAESPVLDSMELALLEWRYRVANEISTRMFGPVRSSDISLVIYDDLDQFELEGDATENGPAPIQEVLARLIPVIESGNPLLVVLDLDLRGRANPDLVRTLQKYKDNVVLALLGDLENTLDYPANDLRKSVRVCAYDHLVREPNGLVCQLPIALDMQDTTSGYTKREAFESLPEVVATLMTQKGGVGPSKAMMTPPSADSRPLYIDFTNVKYDTFRARKVLAEDFNPSVFQNKTVMIGTHFAQKTDTSPQTRTALSRTAPGVKIQADAIRSMHNNRVISTFPKSVLHHFLLLAGAAFGALASVLSMSTRTTTFICTSMILLFLTQASFLFWHLHVPIVPLLAMLMLSFVFGTLIYLDTDLRLRNRELATAREAMQVRAEEERQRIAEDLHDETLPALSSVARLADRLSTDLGGENPIPSQMREKLDHAVQEMRRVINDLHPSALETMGFKPALENLLFILEREKSISTSFHDGDGSDDYGLPKFTKLQLYRIVQETINNIEKHSHADLVELCIGQKDDNLLISVIDNGKGIDPKAIRRDSHGLINIRQRAQLIGAQVEWKKPEKFPTGTEVNLKIPIGVSEIQKLGVKEQ